MSDDNHAPKNRGRATTGDGQRLALYCRVSTDVQTVDNQIHELAAYAERRGLPYDVFADQGVSGLPESLRPVSTASKASWSRRCMMRKSQPAFIRVSTCSGSFAG